MSQSGKTDKPEINPNHIQLLLSWNVLPICLLLIPDSGFKTVQLSCLANLIKAIN